MHTSNNLEMQMARLWPPLNQGNWKQNQVIKETAWSSAPKNHTASLQRVGACRSAKEKKYLCSPFIFAGPRFADMFVRRANFTAGSFRLPGGPEHIGDTQSCSFQKSLRPKSLEVSTDKIITGVQRFCLGIPEMRTEKNKFLNQISFWLGNLMHSQRNLREGVDRNSNATGKFCHFKKTCWIWKEKTPKVGISLEMTNSNCLLGHSLTILFQQHHFDSF